MATIKHNVEVKPNEAAFYVPYENFYMWSRIGHKELVPTAQLPVDRSGYKMEHDPSQLNFDVFKHKVVMDLKTKFPSLHETDEYLNTRKTQHKIAENKLFDIVLEDNDWSVAVELRRKENANEGMQNQTYADFVKGIQTILLDHIERIYTRAGNWDCITLTKDSPLGFGTLSSIDFNIEDSVLETDYTDEESSDD